MLKEKYALKMFHYVPRQSGKVERSCSPNLPKRAARVSSSRGIAAITTCCGRALAWSSLSGSTPGRWCNHCYRKRFSGLKWHRV
jgi:hypothetical protein